MNRILDDLQICDELFWEPARLVPPEAWVGSHSICFLARQGIAPRCSSSTHSGNSFSAFCQPIATLGIPGRAFAVDTWKGDEHAGHYGEEVFEDLAAFNNAH
jgi:hypothetical protein